MDENLMPSRYDAISTEPKWYACWEEAGLFQPDPDDTKPKWSLTIPPPNITGSLHMGHALGSTMQDILIRWKRMQGSNAMWMPGIDHASIAAIIASIASGWPSASSPMEASIAELTAAMKLAAMNGSRFGMISWNTT